MKRLLLFYFLLELLSSHLAECQNHNNERRKQTCEKSWGRNRNNKITELSGPVCFYNISCIRKGSNKFACDMISARTIALFHHCSDAKSPAKPSKTLIKQIWALHGILATAGRFIKRKSKHQFSVVLAKLF